MSLARDSLLFWPSDDGEEACVAKRQSSRRLPPSAKNRPPPAENPNLLLAALPAADYARILPELSVVPLTLKTVLHKPGEAIRHVRSEEHTSELQSHSFI